MGSRNLAILGELLSASSIVASFLLLVSVSTLASHLTDPFTFSPLVPNNVGFDHVAAAVAAGFEKNGPLSDLPRQLALDVETEMLQSVFPSNLFQTADILLNYDVCLLLLLLLLLLPFLRFKKFGWTVYKLYFALSEQIHAFSSQLAAFSARMSNALLDGAFTSESYKDLEYSNIFSVSPLWSISRCEFVFSWSAKNLFTLGGIVSRQSTQRPSSLHQFRICQMRPEMSPFKYD